MPPPTPTTRIPPTVASTAISTGVVTVVATPIWLSAAITPNPRMNHDARLASNRPYDNPPRAAETTSLTALAIAAATTTMMMATAAFGSHATTPEIRSLTGFGPHIPNAN